MTRFTSRKNPRSMKGRGKLWNDSLSNGFQRFLYIHIQLLLCNIVTITVALLAFKILYGMVNMVGSKFDLIFTRPRWNAISWKHIYESNFISKRYVQLFYLLNSFNFLICFSYSALDKEEVLPIFLSRGPYQYNKARSTSTNIHSYEPICLQHDVITYWSKVDNNDTQRSEVEPKVTEQVSIRLFKWIQWLNRARSNHLPVCFATNERNLWTEFKIKSFWYVFRIADFENPFLLLIQVNWHRTWHWNWKSSF